MAFSEDVTDELDRLRSYETQRRAAGAAIGAYYDYGTDRYRTLDPGQTANIDTLSSRLGDYQKKYWWLPPSVQHSLAKAGITADSPAAQAAAGAGAKIVLDKGAGFAPIGATVKASSIAATGVAQPYRPGPDLGLGGRRLGAEPAPLVGDLGIGGRQISAPASPLQQIAGDEWFKLAPAVRQELERVSFSAAPADQVALITAAAEKTRQEQEAGTWHGGGAPTGPAAPAPYVPSTPPTYYSVTGAQGFSKDALDAFRRLMSQTFGTGVTIGVGDDAPVPGLQGQYVKITPPDPNAGEKARAAQLEISGATASGFQIGAQAADVVLSAPLQEVQGLVRDVYGVTHGESFNPLESQSTLGVVAGDILHGRDVDLGSGFFVDPNSPTVQERQRRERERGLIGNHAVTIGRWAADTVATPDTVPFNALSGAADLAFAIGADPTNIALAKYSKLKEAEKMFTEAGGLFGLRRTVSPAAVNQFWDNPERGGAVIDWVARHDKTYDIWEGFDRKIPVEVAHKLARLDDPAEIDKILRPLSGGTLRYKPDPFNVIKGAVPGLSGETPADLRLAAKRSSQTSRLNNIVPLHQWDLEDATDSVVQTERFLRNVKAPQEMVYDYVDKMAGAANKYERRMVIGEMMGGTNGLLVKKWNIRPDLARDLTTLNDNVASEMRKSFVDETGQGVNVFGRTTRVGGTDVLQPDRMLLDEYIGRYLPMPDTRELRRMTSRFRPVLATQDANLIWPLAAMDFMQTSVWKPMQLLRGAWTVRVIGEEQIRMAAAGLDSIFHHPLSALAYALADEKPLGKALGRVIERKATASLAEESFADIEQWQQAMTRGAGKFDIGTDPHRVRSGDWIVVPKDDAHMAQYLDGLGSELTQLHNDTIARIVARSESIDDAVEQVGHGPGRGALATLAKVADAPELLDDPAFLRHYVEEVQRRISIKTGDHPDLLEAVRTGRLNGEALSLIGDGRTALNPKMVTQLRDYLDVAPDAVKTPRMIRSGGEHLKDRYDRVVEGLFGHLMSRPTNWLSRSPAFKQFYWSRVPELMPLATAEAQEAAIAAARAANVDKSVIKAMEAARSSTGEFTLDHMDMLAKGHGLDETRKLLYDISEKSQFFDATRLIFPFGEAWKEVLTRWAHLFTARPQNVRRLQQIIGAARGEGLQQTISGITGDPVQGGFFHKNERGEEVFTYPGSTWLTSKMIGVPIPLSGRVSGLNMIGQIYPALGPMSSIPIAALLPDTPKYDTLRDTLFPFGAPGSPLEKETWLPPWIKRILQPSDDGLDNTRLYTNTVMDVTRYLASTGDYDLHTAEGQSKLQEDARDKAGQFNLIRGFAQFFAPSSPSPDWLVKDKTGNVTSAAILATEYRSLQQQEHQGIIPSASQTFLDRYGTEPFLLMQSKTQAVAYGYPTDSVGLDWMRDHPDLQTKFPNLFGYFAPQSDDPNDFSYNAYLRAISTGAKNPLTLEQFVKLGMARLASLRYDEAKTKVDTISGGKAPSDQNRLWLRSVREALIREYPGYDESLGLTRRAGKPEQIRELTAAVKDPTIAATEAGKALVKYLAARDKALESANKIKTGMGFQTAQSARPIRDWLRQVGEALVRENRTFEPLWSQILDSEMNDDLNPGSG